MKKKKLLVNKIINLMYDKRPCAFHYAYKLLGLLGYKDKDKIKPEHATIFKLTWLASGDDEPFSDCGISKLTLRKELENTEI